MARSSSCDCNVPDQRAPLLHREERLGLLEEQHTRRHPVQRHHQVVLLTDTLTSLSPQRRTARQAAQPKQWAIFTAGVTHSRGCTTRWSGTAAAWGWTPQHSAAVQFAHPPDNCIACPPPSLLLCTRLRQKDRRRTGGVHRVRWHGRREWFHAGPPQAAGRRHCRRYWCKQRVTGKRSVTREQG